MQTSDIELLLQDTLLKGFGRDIPNGNNIEFLHDNGPEYIEGHFKDQMKK
jgi:putative transposase